MVMQAGRYWWSGNCGRLVTVAGRARSPEESCNEVTVQRLCGSAELPGRPAPSRQYVSCLEPLAQ